jgi:hypothetical protein
VHDGGIKFSINTAQSYGSVYANSENKVFDNVIENLNRDMFDVEEVRHPTSLALGSLVELPLLVQ